jgi:hypothetical protein
MFVMVMFSEFLLLLNLARLEIYFEFKPSDGEERDLRLTL